MDHRVAVDATEESTEANGANPLSPSRRLVHGAKEAGCGRSFEPSPRNRSKRGVANERLPKAAPLLDSSDASRASNQIYAVCGEFFACSVCASVNLVHLTLESSRKTPR